LASTTIERAFRAFVGQRGQLGGVGEALGADLALFRKAVAIRLPRV
jgi:hypothetical protein